MDSSTQISTLQYDTQALDTPTAEAIDVYTELDTTPPQPQDTIAIIVQSSIYSSVEAAVFQYRQDLNDTGYHTILYTEPITTAEELKANLSLWYTSEDLIGAVLIGRLPYAQFHHDATSNFNPETFICDLFLMDLDGTWRDVSPHDGIYDQHYALTGTDIFPEIFIGRIDPTCLSWGSVVSNINTYLSRIHDYRTGGVVRTHRALFYVDDDWMPWAYSWSNDGGLAYGTRTLIYTPGTYTNATDWLTNRILQDYQWGHLCAHSSATTHYFGSSGVGEGTVSSTQIHNAPPSFNFYNLFCCSGAEWTTANNLGVTYTFSGSYSLASVGSSKTGGMLDLDKFYSPLGQNNSLGQSLANWFSDVLMTSSDAGAEYLPWYYGMNIIGDPLLTIYYDCTVLPPSIQSDTHPDQGVWYTNQRPQINWTVPPDVNDIIGYYYILNQNPTTVPTKDTGIFTTVNGTFADEDLESGIWYYHVVAVDSAWNIGSEAAHYAIHIDVTGPNLSIINPLPNGNCSSASLTVKWSCPDQYSGYSRTLVWIDESSSIIHNSSSLECTLADLSEGAHVLNLTSYDSMANSVSEQFVFYIDLTDPTLTILEPLNQTVIVGDVFLDWTASDTGSGYHYSEIYIDDEFLIRIDAPNSSCYILDFPSGSYSIDVKVYDWAGRFSVQSISITIKNSSDTIKSQLYAILQFSAVVLVGLVIAIILWKRRKG